MIGFKNNILIINNLSIPFKREIKEIVTLPQGIVTLLHANPVIDENEERNVYFLDFNGQIKWQIQHNSEPNESAGYQGYTKIYFHNDGFLRAYSFAGMSCKVDITTGKIISKVEAK